MRTLAMALWCLAWAAPAHAERAHIPTWRQCRFTLSHGIITDAACHSYRMYGYAGQRVTGQRLKTRQSAHLRIISIVPTFHATPASAHVTLWITGYSFACGDINGVTADGSPAQVGDVSSDNPAYWHHHISIPSLGYHGYVNDRGVGTGGLDVFMASCADTYLVTRWREVIISP